MFLSVYPCQIPKQLLSGLQVLNLNFQGSASKSSPPLVGSRCTLTSHQPDSWLVVFCCRIWSLETYVSLRKICLSMGNSSWHFLGEIYFSKSCICRKFFKESREQGKVLKLSCKHNSQRRDIPGSEDSAGDSQKQEPGTDTHRRRGRLGALSPRKSHAEQQCSLTAQSSL